ncbi:hypothetical protein B566_EDAN005868 [Ephemera danica]|nr:hypothetical protein B566_EDAN005868 [Ephemera danica]
MSNRSQSFTLDWNLQSISGAIFAVGKKLLHDVEIFFFSIPRSADRFGQVDTQRRAGHSPVATTSAAEAVAKCVERNMTLVSFLTLDQFNGAVDLIANMNISAYNFWTSGMMIFGNWTWGSNGKPLTYSAWADREPDYEQDVYDQACILLQNSELYDVDCYFGGVGYICEQPYSC